MKQGKWLIFAGLSLLAGTASADTTWVAAGNISGEWDTTGSPYMIYQDHVTVVSNDTLLIGPGVKVEFTGHYKFNVNGLLQAIGTEEDSIFFTTDTLVNPDRWWGIRFDQAHDSCRLEYCVIEYGKAEGTDPDDRGGGVSCNFSSPIFSNCTIRENSAGNQGGGIFCYGSSSSFTNCIIQDNVSASTGGGIFSVGSSSTFTNCIISGNYTIWAGGGVLCALSGVPSFVNCTIVNNSTNDDGGGVFCLSASANFNSTIIAFSNGSGIHFYNSSSTTVEYCDIFGNSGEDIAFEDGNPSYGPAGIGLLDTVNANADSCDSYSNIFFDPMFADTSAGDYHLTASSHCIGAGDSTDPPPMDFEGNPRPNPPGSNPDIGAYENEQATPIMSLCGSLSGVLGPDTFHVVCPIYVENGDTLQILPGTVFHFDGYFPFMIYGTLLAEGTESDSIYFTTNTLINPDRWHGIRFVSAQDSSRLEYCVIEYGRAEGDEPDSFGGGVYCSNSSPILRNCTIRNNLAIGDFYTGYGLGGGVFCDSSSPNLTHCLITGNLALNGGGVYSRNFSMPSFTYCTISGDSAESWGGGVYCRRSSPNFLHCAITGNYGWDCGGVLCDVYSAPNFSDCIISNNTAFGLSGGVYCHYSLANFTDCIINNNLAMVGSGGGVYCSWDTTWSAPTFNNCVISGNEAVYGGGVMCEIATPIFTNCTISGNRAVYGGGMFFFQSVVTVNSTIIAFSTSAIGGIVFSESGGSQLEYCDIFGNSGGTFSGGIPYGLGQIVTTNGNNDSCDIYYNIYLDPLLSDTSMGDFSLQYLSPCIDAGDPVLPLDPDTTVTDIGAFYYHQNPGGVANPVSDLVIDIQGDSMVLSWSPVIEDTVGNPITVDYYRIYRDTIPAFEPTGDNLIDSTAATTYTDPGILNYPEQAYFYIVTAVSLRRTMSGALNRYHQLGKRARQREIVR